MGWLHYAGPHVAMAVRHDDLGWPVEYVAAAAPGYLPDCRPVVQQLAVVGVPGLDAQLVARGDATPADRAEVDQVERCWPRLWVGWGATSEATTGQVAMQALAAADVPVRGSSDDILEAIAKVWPQLADHPAPAPAIAAAMGVPADRVRAWVREARRRGLLDRVTTTTGG